MSLRNSIALITGGAQGFGKGFAGTILEAGGKVWIHVNDALSEFMFGGLGMFTWMCPTHTEWHEGHWD